ncbi:MAG: hypothetical protein JSS07_02115 [Proteobacteria bacterium]|nr:hypothetical protein [Pseudomonadota bacterium]
MADIHIEACANHFYRLSIDLPLIQNKAEPGHYILINQQHRAYILGNNPLALIIPNTLLEQAKLELGAAQIQISLLGKPIPAPLTSTFNLLVMENEALSAGLFYLRKYRQQFKGLVLIGTNQTFPFNPCPSKYLLPGIPADLIAGLPLLEDWGIPSRLASFVQMPGVYHGSVQALANLWLNATTLANINKIHFSSLLPQNTTE